MEKGDTKHLKWLHDRFVNVYNENENVDFLIKFRNIIKELEEAMKHKTCDGCKFDYDIDNFDSIDGKRLDSFRPNECYMCSRNMQDRYEVEL